MNAISAPAGISSLTVTTLPTLKLPASRHVQLAGVSNAGFASVLKSGPPLTRKLNCLPQYCGDSLSLQIFRSPIVPPAGWFVKVILVSLAAVAPTGTLAITVRFSRSWLINRPLGRTSTFFTSVGGTVCSSTTRLRPGRVVIGPLQRPPRTVNGEPPFSVNWNGLLVMPLYAALQTSILPVGQVVLSAFTPSRSNPSAFGSKR